MAGHFISTAVRISYLSLPKHFWSKILSSEAHFVRWWQ